MENLEIAVTRIKNSQHPPINWTNLNYFLVVLNWAIDTWFTSIYFLKTKCLYVFKRPKKQEHFVLFYMCFDRYWNIQYPIKLIISQILHSNFIITAIQTIQLQKKSREFESSLCIQYSQYYCNRESTSTRANIF